MESYSGTETDLDTLSNEKLNLMEMMNKIIGKLEVLMEKEKYYKHIKERSCLLFGPVFLQTRQKK